jgi:hypothetical protein
LAFLVLGGELHVHRDFYRLFGHEIDLRAVLGGEFHFCFLLDDFVSVKSPASEPRTSTRRLTNEIRCSTGNGLSPCATTFMARLPGTKRKKDGFLELVPRDPYRKAPCRIFKLDLLGGLE